MKSLAFNKRAKFDYDIVEVFVAGIKLLGTEVKSVRAGNMSLKGAFVTIHNDQALLTNAHIPPWQVKNTPPDFDPTRSRPLLLKKSEAAHMIGTKQQKGLTIIPLRVYSKGPRIKVEIALARGKRQYNKKEAKKEQDIKRDVARLLRGKE